MGKKAFKISKILTDLYKRKRNCILDTRPLCLFYFWTPVLETIASYESAETAELNENGKLNQSNNDNENDVMNMKKNNQTKDDNENDNAVYEDEKKLIRQRMIMITIMVLMIMIMKMIILLMMMRKLFGPRSPGWRW